MAGLDRLAKGGLGEVGQGAHGDGLAGAHGAVGESAAGGAAALDGGEDDAVALVGLVGANVGRQAGGVVGGQVRAAEDADLDVAVDHEAEADGILAAAEEALGAVNGVNGPDAALGATGAVSAVNELEHGVDAGDGATKELLGLIVGELGALDKLPDGVSQVRVLAQLRRLLLGNNGILGEVVLQGSDDEGLGAKVANGDGALVVFVDGALCLFVEDLLGEDCGALDG